MSSFTLRAKTAVPVEHKRNFWHLYLDIFWFGVVSGSAINFMAIFATRQGASGWQMGLLNAAPGIVTLAIALPTGQYLRTHSVSQTTFWAAVGHRFFYLFWAFLPILFTPARQVQWLIVSLFLMSIPGTVLAIGFNNLLASTVPADWRGHVVGTRNAVFAAASIITSFLCGWLLNTLSFNTGYQIVFAIGACGALMSTLHLYFIKPTADETAVTNYQQPVRDWARPGSVRSTTSVRTAVGLRALSSYKQLGELLNWEVFSGRYKQVLFLLFSFHLAQYIAIPLFPLYTVNQLGLSDQTLSLGNVLFYSALFLGSTQLSAASKRWGHQTVLGIGAVLMCSYPFLVAGAFITPIYFIASIAGGVAWTFAGGAVGNYLFEQIPDEDRPPYLAWYNLGLNSAVLLGSFIGPLLANVFGIFTALLIAGVLRLISGIAIWRWG